MTAFRHRMRVRYSDCDPQGVVFNANYLTYFDIAITELWRDAFGSYEEATRAHDVDLVVAEATVRYRSPIAFDEEIDLCPVVSRMGTTSLLTTITIERDSGLAAEGEIRHVFVRYGTAQKTPIPDELRSVLATYSQPEGA